MRICVLQPPYQNSDSKHEVSRNSASNPGISTSQHTFEHRFIRNETAKTQIHTIVQEGFDFYMNFLWGTSSDPAAEIQASQYFESLKLPSAGFRSKGYLKTGGAEYSLLPSWQREEKGSVGAGERLQTELDRHTDQSLGKGEYTVSIIELGSSAIALNPRTVKSNEMIKRTDQPKQFELLQQTALDFFETSVFRGSHMGCDLDLQVNRDEVIVTKVNPLPMSFLQHNSEFQDLRIFQSFPGGLDALVNVFIANSYLHDNTRREPSKVAASYDTVATEYDEQGETSRHDRENVEHIVKNYEFDGNVVDIACGTGFFGRVLQNSRCKSSQGPSSLVGFDLSPGMADMCRKTGLYEQVYVAGMQNCLLEYLCRDEVDHIVCFSAVHYLSSEEFALFLVQCFVIARRSITVAVDEIPDAYNEHLRFKGFSHMHSLNHLAHMKAFGEPQGWRLVNRRRHYSWKSPNTGDDVYSTFFRFERIGQKNEHILRMERN